MTGDKTLRGLGVSFAAAILLDGWAGKYHYDLSVPEPMAKFVMYRYK